MDGDRVADYLETYLATRVASAEEVVNCSL